MSTLSLVDGLAGFATLHPVFTLAPLLLGGFLAYVAARRVRQHHTPQPAPVRGR